MALRRSVAEALFNDLLEAGYKVRLTAWAASPGWKMQEPIACSVSATSDPESKNSAGVISTAIAGIAAIGERHGQVGYVQTHEDTVDYESWYTLTVIFTG